MYGVQRVLAAALAVAGLVGVSGTAAFASAASTAHPGSLQRAVERQLRDYPGGTQVAANEVSYDHGHVIVAFPGPNGHVQAPRSSGAGPDASYSWHGCPYGDVAAWYCFYQNSKFGGRMLEFEDCSGDGTKQSFGTYGFSNETSSWVNTSGIEPLSTPVGVDVWGASTILWTEEEDSSSSYVGAANNDKAQWFDAYC
jgi:hypothetical protein